MIPFNFNPWVLSISIAGSLLVGSVIVIALQQVSKKRGVFPIQPLVKETAYALISSVQQTDTIINNRPQLEFTLLVFPPDGPARTVTARQFVSFADLPSIQPGKYVNISYEAGTFRHLHIDGAKNFMITGVPFNMQYFQELDRKLSGDLSLETQGIILGVQETGTYVDSLPVYRYRASFLTRDENTVEAETLQISRPWFLSMAMTGSSVAIKYSRENPEVFVLGE